MEIYAYEICNNGAMDGRGNTVFKGGVCICCHIHFHSSNTLNNCNYYLTVVCMLLFCMFFVISVTEIYHIKPGFKTELIIQDIPLILLRIVLSHFMRYGSK